MTNIVNQAGIEVSDGLFGLSGSMITSTLSVLTVAFEVGSIILIGLIIWRCFRRFASETRSSGDPGWD